MPVEESRDNRRKIPHSTFQCRLSSRIRPFPPNSITNCITTPALRPSTVATPAPATPIAGTGPHPKIRIGSSTIFNPLATHNTFIAIAASPAPRKIALIRKSNITLNELPSTHRVYDAPPVTTCSSAPISRNKSGARHTAGTPTNTAAPIPNSTACTAARAAPSPSFSPIRRATIAVVASAMPIASEYITVIRVSVTPTAAAASAPNFATKKMSTIPKRLSMHISSTIGIASSTIARFSGACV